LKFPHDAHDDFVDALALIGLGLQQLMPIVVGRPIEKNRMFSFGWLKQQRDDQRRQARFSFSAGGW
jgi:hypothetical protein